MRSRLSRLLRVITVAVVLSVSAACATPPEQHDPPDGQVTNQEMKWK